MLLKDQIEINGDHYNNPKSFFQIRFGLLLKNFGFNHLQIENWISNKHQSGKYIESKIINFT